MTFPCSLQEPNGPKHPRAWDIQEGMTSSRLCCLTMTLWLSRPFQKRP